MQDIWFALLDWEQKGDGALKDGDFSLRPATEEDLDRVSKIEGSVQLVPWTRKHFEEELQKPYSRFLILTDDETDTLIAGFIVYWIQEEDLHILNVAVDTPYRGKGMGRFLMRKAMDDARQSRCKRLILEVRKSNDRAVQLYHAMGFEITFIRKNFYSDGEDAYQMEKEAGTFE